LRWCFWLLLLFVACLGMPGCGGCGGNDEGEVAEEEAEAEAEKEKAKQKEKPKRDFEEPKLHIQPDMPAPARVFAVKPGHWTMATSEMKANNFDYVGELHATVSDRSGQPIILESTSYEVATVRAAPLPKGQQKFFDFLMYVPREVPAPRLHCELRIPGGGITQSNPAEILSLMPPHQFYFLILSARPEAFRSVTRSDTRLDAIRAPGDETDAVIYYKAVAPRMQKTRVPLPSNALAWSSIAYILWDDVDPTLFDMDQRQALLDWLHWGGQLIISGPGTLDKLRGSFLDPSKDESYLPALPGESVKLSPDKVRAMGEPWKTPGKQNQTKGRELVIARDWAAVGLKKHPDARFVEDTQEQVVERQIGRGRIVITSFRIGQPSFLNWPSFDCFLNAVLLRRDERRFVSAADTLHGVAMRWVEDDGSMSRDILDARRTTTLRYFTRDVNDQGNFAAHGRSADVPSAMASTEPLTIDLQAAAESGDGVVLDENIGHDSGLGGWNDFTGAAAAARASLREAAGIKIPNATFVVFVLAVYLAVLVPLNWGIFRVVGRIELAWIAAPVIAVAGALSVIKLAELDIGFARSLTEISVLEAHNNYPRAHLTRYTALYASLTTTYDLVFDDKNALALPFPADPKFERLHRQGTDRVEYHRDEFGVRLAGFKVDSNSTGMIHSEQMFDLGGRIAYTEKNGRHEVYNRTKYAIHNAGVIRRDRSGRMQVAWLGDLQPGMGRAASFSSAPRSRPLLAQWKMAPGTAVAEVDHHLARLLDLAQRSTDLEIEEVRLLGMIREPLPGMTVEPEPSQNERSPTLLVAHLKQTALDKHPPRRDQNSRVAVTGTEPSIEEDELEETLNQ
jgi:hypothetical protein